MRCLLLHLPFGLQTEAWQDCEAFLAAAGAGLAVDRRWLYNLIIDLIFSIMYHRLAGDRSLWAEPLDRRLVRQQPGLRQGCSPTCNLFLLFSHCSLTARRWAHRFGLHSLGRSFG